GASSPSGRTLGSIDIAFVCFDDPFFHFRRDGHGRVDQSVDDIGYLFALQPDLVRNPRDDFIRRRAASGELVLIDAPYLFPKFGRQFSGFRLSRLWLSSRLSFIGRWFFGRRADQSGAETTDRRTRAFEFWPIATFLRRALLDAFLTTARLAVRREKSRAAPGTLKAKFHSTHDV